MAEVIQTEVDKLIALVQKEEKISVRQAAKKIGVSASTIAEWAGFLEEEGLINIEYSLTVPYLVKRKLDEKQVAKFQEKVKEEKDIFKRKSESTLEYFNKLEEEVNSLKEIFGDIKSNFKKKMSEVKEELSRLKEAETEKDKLDKEIIESKHKFIKEISELNKSLLEEKNTTHNLYDLLLDQSQLEKRMLAIQKGEFALITTTNKLLDQRLKKIQKAIQKKQNRRLQKDQEKLAKESQKKLQAMEKRYLKAKEYLGKEKKIIDELLNKNRDYEKEVDRLQKEVIKKIKQSNEALGKKIGNTKDMPKKLEEMMGKRNMITKILDGILYNEKMLKQKLFDLMKKESALKIVDGSDQAVSEVTKLEQELEEISNKRNFFEKEINKIFKLIKS